MKSTILKFCICIIVALSFSACSIVGLEPKNLISPPLTNKDQQKIYELLAGVDGEIKFLYPKRGDLRSAVLTYDMNGDNIDDSASFIFGAGDGSEIVFMISSENELEVSAKFTNLSTQIDKVLLSDLDGNGIDELLVGWGSPQSLSSKISVYQYVDGSFVEHILEQNYDDFISADIDNDNIDEIFIAKLFLPSEEEHLNDRHAKGMIFELAGKLELTSTVALNNSIVKYSSCQFVKINKNENAILLDGVLAQGNMITEIVMYKNDNFTSVLSNYSQETNYNNFERPAILSMKSQDIDGDGITELMMVYLPEYFDEHKSISAVNYYVDWVQYNSNKNTLTTIKRSIANTDFGFMFTIPLEKEIICTELEENVFRIGEIVNISHTNQSYKKNYIDIKFFTREQWSDTNGYKYLFVASNGMVCSAKTLIFDDYNLLSNIKSIS